MPPALATIGRPHFPRRDRSTHPHPRCAMAGSGHLAPKIRRRDRSVSPDPLAIDTDREGSRAVVIVRGELDLLSSPTLTDHLEGLDASVTTVELDLSELTFVDSSGLNALLADAEAPRRRGRWAAGHRGVRRRAPALRGRGRARPARPVALTRLNPRDYRPRTTRPCRRRSATSPSDPSPPRRSAARGR